MADLSRPHSLAGVATGAGQPVRIMGVLNVSPESFYAGSVRSGAENIAAAARRMVEEGADFVDIGAMSTAPYLQTGVSSAQECQRMERAVAAVRAVVDVPISVDTSRAEVAVAAMQVGARIVNDVRGLRGEGMAEAALAADGVVLMASPEESAVGGSPSERVRADLLRVIARATGAGIAPESIAIDPGIGFYTGPGDAPPIDFNCTVLARLSSFRDLGYPLLVGLSRKAFLGAITGRRSADERLAGSLAASALAVCQGAAIVRTHDVAETLDAVRVAEEIRNRMSAASSR